MSLPRFIQDEIKSNKVDNCIQSTNLQKSILIFFYRNLQKDDITFGHLT